MSLIGQNVNLRGALGWKGEKGDNAYKIAVQNGFIGSEQDWLATIGTTSHFTEDSIIHTATEGQTNFAIPSIYTSNSFIDVYVNGLRLNSNEYTIDISTKKINLVGIVLNARAIVEIVVLTMSTNSLPIVETINENSTNETAPGTKAVYNYVQNESNKVSAKVVTLTTETNTKIDTFESETNTKIDTFESEINTLNNKITNNVNTINDTIEQLSNNIDSEKLNKSNIQTLTGSIQNIGAGETATASISYPSGFTKTNTLIISKMCSSGNAYYDVVDATMTTNGFPTITLISLTDTAIKVGLKNTNSTTAFTGHYKITIMRND
jgi:hypothetical protein